MNKTTKLIQPKVFILDVDGVMTSGHFYYTDEGKVMKVFGPDDNDALSLLQPYLEIRFITGDRKGYPITKKRIVDDMGFKLDLVSTIHRVSWIKEHWKGNEVIYMGDGIFDHYVFKEVAYSIAPSNSDPTTLKMANYVTKRGGGDRAVAEAALHLLEHFFTPYDPTKFPDKNLKLSGEWHS